MRLTIYLQKLKGLHLRIALAFLLTPFVFATIICLISWI